MNTKAYFNLANAKSLGRTTATVLERILFWIGYSTLEHEGKIFCFRTLEQLAEECSMSVSTVQRAIAQLIALGYIVKEKLKASQWNQVNCYAKGERLDVPDDTETWPDRAEQTESMDDRKMKSSSMSNKKSSIKRKIKEVQATARKMARGFGRAFKGDTPVGACKACKGSGTVNDEHYGYRCLCADGRSKSAQIPAVPEQLFLSLRNQIA